LLGATVSEEYRVPDLGTPYLEAVYSPQVFEVGAGQESAITIEGVTTFNIDFADTSLLIAFDTVLANPTLGNSSFNGLVFTSTAFSQITGAAVDATTNLAGFDASRVAIVGNELRLNFAGLSYDTDTALALNFSSQVSAIPEPASWAMMMLGLGFVGGAMRSTKQRQKVAASYT